MLSVVAFYERQFLYLDPPTDLLTDSSRVEAAFNSNRLVALSRAQHLKIVFILVVLILSCQVLDRED